jgi:hypothetical protein
MKEIVMDAERESGGHKTTPRCTMPIILPRYKHLCVVWALRRHDFEDRAPEPNADESDWMPLAKTWIDGIPCRKETNCMKLTYLSELIVSLLLHPFNAWLGSLPPRSKKVTVSHVQDRDPYLENLLMVLYGQKQSLIKHETSHDSFLSIPSLTAV